MPFPRFYSPVDEGNFAIDLPERKNDSMGRRGLKRVV